MRFKKLLGLFGFAFLSNVGAENLHEHNESCLLSSELLKQIKPRNELLKQGKFKASRAMSRTAYSVPLEPISSTCEVWECYAGEGTEESPYIVTIAAHFSESILSDFSGREIENLMINGVASFNQVLKNSGINTVKLTFNQMVVIPMSDYDFSKGSMVGDIVGYSNCDDCYEAERYHGSDMSLLFHPYPDDDGLRGLTGILGTTAGINLAGKSWYKEYFEEDVRNTIVHEIGHMFGAGHHAGIATSGGAFSYSNAVVCEDEQGNRTSSAVSAWERRSQVLQFSSPDMPCGTSDTDNTRTILETAQRQGSFQDIPQPSGSVSIDLSVSEINEGESFSVTLVRDGDINAVGYVGLWIEGSENYSGSDYRYIKFQAGHDTVVVNIDTLQNNKWNEVDEELTLKLDYPTALSLLDNTSVTAVTVRNIDDKASGYISFDTNSVAVSEGGKISITLNRIGGLDGMNNIDFIIHNISATDKDYRISTKTLTFNDGEEVKSIEIEALKDGIFTENLTFNIKLEGEYIGDNKILSVTIKNIDRKPVVTQSSSGGSAPFLLLLAAFVFGLKNRKAYKLK